MERLHALLVVLLVPPQRHGVWLVSLPEIAGVCPASAVINQGYAITEASNLPQTAVDHPAEFKRMLLHFLVARSWW